MQYMGVASRCGNQKAGVVIRMWVWSECSCLVGGVVRRYIYFIKLLIPTPLVLTLFSSSIPTSLFMFF